MNFPRTETESQLRASGQVTLDSTGNGVLTFDPDNARQRWEVSTVVVSTSQDATATVVPVATIGLNGTALDTMSPGNVRGASWSGNQDTFSGLVHVGPCDFLTVAFSPAPGQDGSSMSGVTATAVVTGTKYTRRG